MATAGTPRTPRSGGVEFFVVGFPVLGFFVPGFSPVGFFAVGWSVFGVLGVFFGDVGSGSGVQGAVGVPDREFAGVGVELVSPSPLMETVVVVGADRDQMIQIRRPLIVCPFQRVMHLAPIKPG